MKTANVGQNLISVKTADSENHACKICSFQKTVDFKNRVFQNPQKNGFLCETKDHLPRKVTPKFEVLRC